MLTQIETTALGALLSREGASTGLTGELFAGDVVQIRPAADRSFGGMLALVTQCRPHQIRAILLRPHRGGCREAWLRLTAPEVAHVGRAHFENPEFGRRCEYRSPGCGWAP